MNIQIYNMIWHFILTFGTLKVLWVFMFIVITVFFMVMVRLLPVTHLWFKFCKMKLINLLKIQYSSGKDELKKYILSNDISAETMASLEFTESMNDTLHSLSEKLSENEDMLKESKCQIKNAEQMLNDMDIKNVTIRDHYKSLMIDLKNDLIRTEEEVKVLQDNVTNLSQRREDLKNDVLKQQEEYQQMLSAFSVELEDKNNNHEQPRCGSRKFGVVIPRIVNQLNLSETESEVGLSRS